MEAGDPTEDVIALNRRMRDAEVGHDDAFFHRFLAHDLIFRRASGAVTSKDEFIAGLGDTRWHQHDIDIAAVRPYPDGVVVTVIVTARATRQTDGGEDTVEGQFQNVRKFVPRDGRWQLVTWINTRIEGSS